MADPQERSLATDALRAVERVFAPSKLCARRRLVLCNASEPECLSNFVPAAFLLSLQAPMLAPWTFLANLASEALLVVAAQQEQQPLSNASLQRHSRFYDVQVSTR